MLIAVNSHHGVELDRFSIFAIGQIVYSPCFAPPSWTPRDTVTGAQSLLVIMTSNQEMIHPPKAPDGPASRSNLRFSSSRIFSLSAAGLDKRLEITTLM
jgi:hypothetical protein